MIDELSFKRAQNGDGEGFYKLLQPIKDRLYRVAFIYTKNEHDALDCVHDSIVKAILAIGKLKQPQYFNTWITRITINTCKDYLRKTKNATPHDLAEFENQLVYPDSSAHTGEVLDLYNALDNLTADERELIAMRYMDDMSTKEIGEVTKAPLGTVRSRLSRTIKKLRAYMEG
ncbi:MAG TPA: sigma-70 family RNA polymerase sigma factor [Firmicutes bacterium]|nr:sigma-70 family RNA polymerase sigma factor [Bacillota bacterium]